MFYNGNPATRISYLDITFGVICMYKKAWQNKIEAYKYLPILPCLVLLKLFIEMKIK